MNISGIIGMVNNAALLLALGLLYDMLGGSTGVEKSTIKQVITGLVLGAIGICVMLNPWHFAPGVMFDTRSVLLSVSGLFFGAFPTLLVAMIMGVFRLYTGGIGAWTGVAVIVTSGGVGVAWRHLRRRELKDTSIGELYLLGLVVHSAMLLWMFSLPRPLDLSVLSRISLPTILIYPMTTALLGWLMVNRGARLRVEETLRKVNRALKSLSECNQAVLRSTEELALLNEICRIIVQLGGYRLTWVGFAEKDEKKNVHPVAQAGFEEGYLDTVKITWADNELGCGPTGMAIRTGKPCINRNLLTNLDYAPWRAEATKRGYASSIAIPLVGNGQTFGALNIYAGELNSFDDNEVNLLVQLADNLAYGIVTLRAKAERKQMEVALQKSQALLNQTQRITKAGGWEYDLANGRLTWTDEVYHLHGVSKDTYDPNNIEQDIRFYAPEDQKTIQQAFEAAIERGEPYDLELQFRPADGSKLWVRTIGQVEQKDGKVVRVFGNIVDITDLKNAEKSLRENEALLSETGRIAQIGGWEFDPVTLKGTWTDEVSRIHDLDPKQETNAEIGMSFYHGEHRKAIELAIKEAIELGKPYDLELEMVSAKVVHKWVRTIGHPIKEGDRVVKVRGSFQDITQRKQADEELRNHREHLKELVKERTGELEEKITEIERMNRLFVGRELRMKELKEKIKGLELKIQNTRPGVKR